MIKSALLKAYWIGSPEVRPFGLGVTAFSQEDAFRLPSAFGYALLPDGPAVQITEGIQITDLDQNHVVLNMGPMLFRGVWYPCFR